MGELRIIGKPNLNDILLPSDVLFDFDATPPRAGAEPWALKVESHLADQQADQVHFWVQ